jgi:dUTP pyrophosphatase
MGTTLELRRAGQPDPAAAPDPFPALAAALRRIDDLERWRAEAPQGVPLELLRDLTAAALRSLPDDPRVEANDLRLREVERLADVLNGKVGGCVGPVPIRWRRLHEGARLPTRGTAGSAGWDLFAAQEARVEPGGFVSIGLGFAAAIPPNWCVRLVPRSGLAARSGIDVGAGLIDPDFCGEWRVLLFKHGAVGVSIYPGDRIAQALLLPVPTAVWIEADTLDDTGRGAGGFGSTGR